MWISWKRKMWKRSLGGTRGTHALVMQRSVHVHVSCWKRPTCTVASVERFTSWYGLKSVDTRRRVGSTHFVSATTARRAVITSPKPWTCGAIVAYALSGTPSPTEVPDG